MPTLKQKRAFQEIMVEKSGSVSKTMRDVGYSENTAKTPSKLTKSDGWQELLETHLPDDLLMKVQKEGLKATKITNSHTEPDKEIPDYPTRHKYLETGLKLKGKLIERAMTQNEVLAKIVILDKDDE